MGATLKTAKRPRRLSEERNRSPRVENFPPEHLRPSLPTRKPARLLFLPMPVPLTEDRNPASRLLDRKSTLEILQIMNAEDARVPEALRLHLPRLAEVVDEIAERWRRGGRVVYVGAGTSGRLGVLDAAEWPPTFGVPPYRIIALIAGGAPALLRAVEGAEDDSAAGTADIAAAGVADRDSVVGLAASGRTPYTIAALREAGRRGALTLAVTCSPGSELARVARYALEIETGPEVVTGSTRLKAGTAQKLVLNMLSTALMVRLGYVYDNFMVNVQPGNEKLRRRAVRIIMELTGADGETARRALEAAADVPTAVVMLRCGCPVEAARERLRRWGSLRAALEAGE